ncbi:tetratricopeptide [Sodiomyces alkalinus F11]|uniref:Peroxisomal targeting signal receptor n=1 Tax=Sodiomyces alkalinus (strain CBS 110278 / VKM F-3762 / F11) TaxID=1314773 RepID=A0A3N2PMB4_SODAK|nr:tetratricopeptide [Sodiomyces alkalinus F11]ROT35609.1 tetratricopeptide [Sodiomyces alkalinus F11]
MSFLGGAECSTSGNPLSQFQKHVQDDNQLQRDRLAQRGPTALSGTFRNATANAPQDERMNSFLNQPPNLQQDIPMANAAVHLDPAHAAHMRAASASPTWANEYQNQAAMESAFNAPPGTHFSPEDFARFQQMNQQQQPASARASPMPGVVHGSLSSPLNAPQSSSSSMNYQFAPSPHMMMSPQLFQPMMSHQAPLQQQQQFQDIKGKGKLVELDENKWEEQFAQLELQDKEDTKQARAAEPELDEMDRAIQSETNEFGDFESIWKGIQAETEAARSMVDDDVFDKFDNNDWAPPDFQGLSGDYWGSRLGDPVIEPYLFEEDNIFGDEKNAFDEGVRIMKEGGNLSLAALAFEAAVQQDPQHVDAWVYLGQAQAQNEKETAALRALEQALKLDPNNQSALMALAVSYTNEGYDSTAYRTLERWLSVRYPQIVSPEAIHPPAELGFTDRQVLREKVTDQFIRAAQLSPDGEHMDPDVQVGLGVLFYGAEDYDKAVDCFTAALNSSAQGDSTQREKLHLLWNRLGATLANSGKSEEAIAAYEKALSIHPNFVRARYNLGVSCINIGCHNEAAAHFLAALDMHKAIERSGRSKAYEILGGGGGAGSASAAGGTNTHELDERLDRMTAQNRSSTLYDTLRRVFTQMGRRDLADKVIPGVDPSIFKGEFDF